jgi:hypothetical protein
MKIQMHSPRRFVTHSPEYNAKVTLKAPKTRFWTRSSGLKTSVHMTVRFWDDGLQRYVDLLEDEPHIQLEIVKERN